MPYVVWLALKDSIVDGTADEIVEGVDDHHEEHG